MRQVLGAVRVQAGVVRALIRLDSGHPLTGMGPVMLHDVRAGGGRRFHRHGPCWVLHDDDPAIGRRLTCFSDINGPVSFRMC